MSARLRVLVVDDARLARREMQTLLAAMDGVECIGEADDVPAAREALARLHPDVVLLDIQMPSGSGFDVLDGLQVPPSVIFASSTGSGGGSASSTRRTTRCRTRWPS